MALEIAMCIEQGEQCRGLNAKLMLHLDEINAGTHMTLLFRFYS